MAIPIIADTDSDLMPDACSKGSRIPWSERSDAEGFLSHGYSVEWNSMSIVNESVQNGIGDGWITHRVVTVFQGELARSKGRRIPVAVLNDFHNTSSLDMVQRGLSPNRQGRGLISGLEHRSRLTTGSKMPPCWNSQIVNYVFRSRLMLPDELSETAIGEE